ncbi:MAG: hypothetical protein U9R34_01495 [Nanoarchaeota archaeon]|nr:hypothetical protein [Nanoarchaeota archaeon]
MNKINLLIIIFILASSSVFAIEGVTQFKANISPDFYELPNLLERAEFTLEIINDESEEKHFRISQIDPHWVIQSEPFSHWTSGITVPAKSSSFTKLYVKPSSINTGRYKILLQITPKGEKVMIKKEMIISIPEPSSRIYQPAIETEVEINEQQDPRDPLKILINLQNKNPLDIKSLRVIIRSDSEDGVMLINEETITSLKPLGTSGDNKNLLITKDLDHRMSPKEDTIRVTLFYDEEIVEPTIPPNKIRITGYNEIIPSETVDKGLLKKSTTRTYTNDGNIEKTDTIKIKTNWFVKIFTRTSPEIMAAKDENGTYWTYSITLKPDETTSTTITTSYRFPVACIIIIILIILGYFVFRSPVLIYKEVKSVHKKSDGTSEAKIQLHVKNRSAITLEDVRIMDKIPPLAGLEKVFHIGTLEPSKITEKEKGGTLMKWDIDEIERFEERLMVYKIKTKFAVLGGFNLPPAVVRFKTPRGDIRRKGSKVIEVKT